MKMLLCLSLILLTITKPSLLNSVLKLVVSLCHWFSTEVNNISNRTKENSTVPHIVIKIMA